MLSSFGVLGGLFSGRFFALYLTKKERKKERKKKDVFRRRYTHTAIVTANGTRHTVHGTQHTSLYPSPTHKPHNNYTTTTQPNARVPLPRRLASLASTNDPPLFSVDVHSQLTLRVRRERSRLQDLLRDRPRRGGGRRRGAVSRGEGRRLGVGRGRRRRRLDGDCCAEAEALVKARGAERSSQL